MWVDADACPKVIKEIIYKAANRVQVITTFVANSYIALPTSAYLKFVQVPKGLDVADSYIVNNLGSGDLVITADIPLASEVIAANAYALNPRGEFYDENNISLRLATRNLMEDLRTQGQISGGPASISNKDKTLFANALDRFLQKNK